MPVSQISAREIDLHREEDVKKIILEIDNEQNRRRKREAWISYQCLEGNQKEYVLKALKDIYPETYSNFRVGDISIPKKVIDKKSKAYKNIPLRKLESDEETSSLEEIYTDFHFHKSFKEFDANFNYYKYGFMWLTWQNPDERGEEEGRYIMHALMPQEFDVIVDQITGEPIIFILSYPDVDITQQAGKSDGIEQTIKESNSDTSAQSKIYSMWSANKFAKVVVKRSKGHGNREKEKINITFTKKIPNVLGRLPGGYLQKDNGIDYPVRQNLAFQSIDWNVAFSDLKTAAATQGHGQLVISHPEGQPIKKAHMGMYTALALPQSKKADVKATTAEYISASPDLAGQLDVLKFDLGNILDEQGIKAKGVVDSGAEKFASGFDRLLSEADVQDIIQDNQGTYSKTIEQDIFLTLKAYEVSMNKPTFNKSEGIEVHFEKPRVLISDSEVLANLKSRDELGTLLDHEKHMILNPNLSEEDALQRELEIQGQKKAKQKEMISLMQKSADPEKTAAAEEEEEEEEEETIGSDDE